MFDWLRRKLALTRREESHAPDVEQARKVQKRQFDEWGDVLKEVRRVEAVVEGRKRK